MFCLAMPHRGGPGVDPEAMCAGIANKATYGRETDRIVPGQAWSSLLPYTFNMLWTGAFNQRAKYGIQYFAMIHDDIVPKAGWLSELTDELHASGADLLSCVVPIKDERGLTSTAVDSTGDNWNPRRLTVRESLALPETFGSADVGGPLLANTGLWVCRLDRPWWEKCFFRQHDTIRVKEGTFEALTMPEDWDFSRQVASHGGVVKVTRKIPLYHERREYSLARPWGWAVDEDCRREFGDAAVKPLPGLAAAVADPLPPVGLVIPAPAPMAVAA